MKIVIVLIWLHFVGDYLLQTDAMAIGKSKSNKWLFYHVFAYSLPMLFIGWKFALLNLALHFLTDFVTSRLSSKAWGDGNYWFFFKVIGFDQAVHLTCLVLTWKYLYGGGL